MTLIAGIVCSDGLVMVADSEEVLGQELRTRGEKLHLIYDPQSDWRIVLAGAGDVDYILMARDFISEKVRETKVTGKDIVDSIRSATHEIWRDYARFEPGHDVQLKLLIGSESSDRRTGFNVVSGAAVRQGRKIEAMGKGDVIFMSLAERLLPKSMLSFIPLTAEATRIFMIYAAMAAKQVPGVGGNTHIVTVGNDGKTRWEKSFKIAAVQRFFSDFHQDVSAFLMTDENDDPTEKLIRTFGKSTARQVRQLQKEIQRIENDPRLA